MHSTKRGNVFEVAENATVDGHFEFPLATELIQYLIFIGCLNAKLIHALLTIHLEDHQWKTSYDIMILKVLMWSCRYRIILSSCLLPNLLFKPRTTTSSFKPNSFYRITGSLARTKLACSQVQDKIVQIAKYFIY